MPEQNSNTNEQAEPKHLDDFKGSPSEVRKAKAEYIAKHGYQKWEELVRNSSIRVKR